MPPMVLRLSPESKAQTGWERRCPREAQSDTAAHFSWQSACDLWFRGDFGEWERLLGSTPKR